MQTSYVFSYGDNAPVVYAGGIYYYGNYNYNGTITLSTSYSLLDVANDAAAMLAMATNSFVLRNEVHGVGSPFDPGVSTNYTVNDGSIIQTNSFPYTYPYYWSLGSNAGKSVTSSFVDLAKMQFHFSYESKTNVSYKVTRYFTVLTNWVACGPDIKVVNVENGTGQPCYTETNFILPVVQNNLIGFQLSCPFKGTNNAITFFQDATNNVQVYPSKVEVVPVNGGCAACSAGGGGGNSAAGNGQFALGSVELNFDLGRMAQGQSVGSLNVSEQTPALDLYSPASLNLLAAPENVTPIYAAGLLRQVGTAQNLVDILPVAQGYQMIYFATNAFTTNSDGVTLMVTNGLTPVVVWTVQNPDTTATNRLQVVETRDSASITNIYSWNLTNNNQTWTLISGNGLKEETLQKVWNTDGTIRTETRQIFNLANTNQEIYQKVEQYQDFGWGEGLIMDVTGTGSAALTNTYAYDGSGNPSPSAITTSDGGVQNYWFDGQRRINLQTSTFQDGATAYTYTYYIGETDLTSYGDNTNFWPLQPRYISEYNPGNSDGGKTTFFIAPNASTSITCIVRGSGASAPFVTGSLCTTNHYYPAGDPNASKLKYVENPDGTVAFYTYASGPAYQTNTVSVGQADSSRTNIVNGTKTVTVLGSVGQVVLNQVYDLSPDHPSGMLINQNSYVYTDVLNRSYVESYLDGTSNTVVYACCGIDTTIDRDGLITLFGYDALKRQTSAFQYQYGVTTAKTFDAAGNLLATTRTGGSPITLQQTAYDDAGRVIFQTNALGGVTAYAYSFDGSGHRVTTTTNPDLGTRIETYYLDGTLKSVTGTAVHPVAYTYAGGTTANNLTADGSAATGQWVESIADGLGRPVETLYPDGSASHSYYNSQGQLTNTVDPDNDSTTYTYNGKGELALTTVDPSGANRITQTTNDVLYDATYGTTVIRSRTLVWLDLATTGTIVSCTETSTNGLNTWQTQYTDGGVGVTTHTQTVPGVSRTVTTTAPDGSYTVNSYYYGRLASSFRYDSGSNQISGATNGYDAYGRQNTLADARNGTTTLVFNNADLVVMNTSPNPGGGSPEVTVTAYNKMLQATNVTQPDGTTVSSSYLLTGELGLQSGSRTYPVAYGYDNAGRMAAMTNWSGGLGGTGARVTTWNYDSQRGWLTGKTYDDGHGPAYAYTYAGRLKTRTWVRGVTTTYNYDTAGSLTNISYNDGVTPGVTNSYDRLGRLKSVICNGMTDTLTYNLANELLNEYFSGGALSGLSVTNGYDQLLRRTNLTALAAGVLSRTAYSYDAASRLATVSDGTNNAAYTYLANSPLVGQILFKQGSTTRMTTTKTYDYLNRLTTMASQPSASGLLPVNFNYSYNAANQRTHNTLADGSYWVYAYDSLGQVTNACKYFADGTRVAGQQFDYAFDTIGNRTQTMAGGDTNGMNLRTASYYANNLNQVTNRDVPPFVDVLGASIFTNPVTVNGSTAYRKEEYFRQQLAVNNTNSALWTSITVSGGASVSGNVYVAQEPETFKYDADGNLTNDGRWAYTWDGENRMVGMTNNTGVGPNYKLTFSYDAKGRRIQKVVTTNNVAFTTNNFLYDGWNLIAETKPDTTRIRTYVWGSDLSGTSQGAGGVGGLLEISYYGSSTTNCFPAYDGNGNVMALVNAADGTVVANYDYAAFGEPIRITGVMAKNNPFRFSTKYADDESDLLYYGYRYYKPSTGTWPSRDPMGEIGGVNLYGFCGNDNIDYFDTDGTSIGSAIHGLITDVRLIGGLPVSVLSGDIFDPSGFDDFKNLPPSQCRILITINGINNSTNDANMLNSLVASSRLYKGANSVKVSNGSHFMVVGDFLQIAGEELGAIDIAAYRAAKQIKAAAAALKKNKCCHGQISIVAHSQGTMVFNRALPLLDASTRNLIDYDGYGPEKFIGYDAGLNSVNNYINNNGGLDRDWVPVVGNWLNPLRLLDISQQTSDYPLTTLRSPYPSLMEHNFGEHYANSLQ